MDELIVALEEWGYTDGLIKGELIRCKDCKFFDRLTSELTFCIRGGTEEEPNAMVMTENDYCSKGERKESEKK